jgi:hypothetical protein
VPKHHSDIYKFDYHGRLGGYDRTRGGHDDRRNMDAAISRLHDK